MDSAFIKGYIKELMIDGDYFEVIPYVNYKEKITCNTKYAIDIDELDKAVLIKNKSFKGHCQIIWLEAVYFFRNM